MEKQQHAGTTAHEPRIRGLTSAHFSLARFGSPETAATEASFSFRLAGYRMVHNYLKMSDVLQAAKVQLQEGTETNLILQSQPEQED